MSRRIAVVIGMALALFAEPVEGASQARRISAIQADAHVALCAEATTRGGDGHTPAVLRLVDLFREVSAHPQRIESYELNRLALQLRLRLENVRQRIERTYVKPARNAKHRNKPSPPAVIVPTTQVLAQQVAVVGGGAIGVGAGLFGPPPAAGTPSDYGADLVAIIQQTISPETWDVNGGNGAIVYYAPLRALVVSAPDSVHAQVGGVVGQLRTAP